MDISDPDDIKKFYNKFASLEFTDNSDVEDAITILMRVKINDEIHTGEYYTHYGIFSEANDTNAETIEGKYISEQELYKIIDDLGYEWRVNNAGAGPLPETSGTPLAPPSDWATADVEKARALNITKDDVIYRYRMSIIREEFCELAYNYIAEFGKNLDVSNKHKFDDTDNARVEALSSLGIIYGKSETEFAPNDLLTREEAATILERLINVVHPGMGTDTEYITFADLSAISDWAMSSIQTIYKLGIMNGVGNDRFAPKDTYTTEQAIVTLVRLYANSGVSKNVIGGADEPTEIVVTTAVTVKNISTCEEKTLSMDDSEAIFDIVRESKDWNDGTSDCLNDCEIKIGNKTIMYHSECGTFNDNERGVSISLDEKTAHHLASILSKYVPLVFECH